MILTGPSIEEAVKDGYITIEPFDPALINPNSYNYRLGPDIYEVISSNIDPYTPTEHKKLELQEDGSYLLLPKKLYLGSTEETIGSNQVVTSLIGRSSVGRLGLFMQITADLGQLGDAHKWTLELKVVSPLKLYPGMKIGQVSFWLPQGNCSNYYHGRYSVYSQPKTHVEQYV